VNRALSADRVQHVDIRGVNVAYRIAGGGPPLVLLHGGPTHSREFCRQLEGLSDEFTVVAWDMPGCGSSADPPEHFRIPDYVACLADFIRALGLEQAHVLGLSFGTGLALELYRAHPEVPRSLILVSAYAGWAGSLPPEVAQQRRQRMLQMIELSPDAWAAEWLPTLLTDSASSEVCDELSNILSDFHPAGQRILLQSGFAEHDLRDVLARISLPALLVYGEKDTRSPLNVAEAMHASIANSQLVVIPGVGHMVDMQAPDGLNVEVRRFLRSVEA
jgi:pimeloyl-ACP methyl ester carboxylesterase